MKTKQQVLMTLKESYKLSIILTDSIMESNFKYEYSIQIASFINSAIKLAKALDINIDKLSLKNTEYCNSFNGEPYSEEKYLNILNLRLNNLNNTLQYNLFDNLITNNFKSYKINETSKDRIINELILFLSTLSLMEKSLNVNLIQESIVSAN